MIGMISAELWQQSEYFYYTVVPVMLVIGLVAILGLMIFLLYQENRHPKAIAVFIGLVLMCGIGFLVGDHVFHDFKELNGQVTPSIRDREKRFVGYKYYDRDTMAVYQRIQVKETIDSFGIYQSEPVTQSITYLGSAHDSVYFKVGEQVYYARMAPTFVAENTAALKGIQYHLTDSSYEKIGFLTETNNYLETIEIPESQAALTFESIDSVIPQEFGKSQSAWALPTDKS